ncbi:ABC transporter B family protein [Dictyostelium purpureum]|uniref:ABC transporter B family protein n=1 Tax=Dictyostelium purpureum TaxID=5786 RepID=F0ZDA2_DICPU|nr:ABC transporter B family protein [Dictyostelium purpureum]EGC38102.1 ABC transporter B family protein [Dictyostelium purpureum]|eukprot:XP_003285409.1 ABC transporter B family protein [Dictyostelium purpureum]
MGTENTEDDSGIGSNNNNNDNVVGNDDLPQNSHSDLPQEREDDYKDSNNKDEIPMSNIKSKDIEPMETTLDGNEVEIVKVADPKKSDDKKEEEGVGPQVPFFKMFRFANKVDILLMVLGTLGAMANGVSMPAISIVFGRLMNVFSPQNLNDPAFDLVDEVTKNALLFIYIGIGVFVCSYMEVTFWMLAGERQAVRCRKAYFKAILRQEIGWYDITKSSELSTRISSDTLLFQEGIGEKIGNFIHHSSTFIAGFIVGFVNGWQLTLVIFALTPLIAAAGAFVSKMMADLTKAGQDAYAQAGAVAEEKIGSIRTVSTFSGEPGEVVKYSACLKEALKVGIKKGLMNGIGIGLVFLVLFGTYSLSFWYGGKLIVDKHWNPVPGRDWQGGDVLTVFFSVIMGAMALGQASPHVASFANGRGAAYKIYQVLDRESKIDPFTTEGRQHNEIQGNIEYRGISFAYPSRPDVQIFNNFNLSIKQGQTVALVGDSGGGKSSAIALLERFYDPLEGEIILDGINIKDINVNCLRKNIGLVSQEPVLFATTIAENIRYGNENATMEQIIEACKTANAHDFISALPEKYDTQVGEKGVQMSGGQKQRIAIARAMIKDPKILLLDEATSALDAENEHLVQQAIDKLMKGRTTIVIAHRLSSIVNSDVIAVVKGGNIVEQGTHNDLFALDGVYTTLVKRQQSGEDEEEKKKRKKNREEKAAAEGLKKAEEESSSAVTAGADVVEDKDGKKKKKKKERSVPIGRILKLSKPDWPLFLLGFIGSAINGAIMPVFSIIFSEILEIFQEVDPNELTRRSRNMALWFILLAVVAGLANFVQIYCFTYIGEKLTYNLRRLSFNSIIRQDIGWFDLTENSTGRLTTNLATEATLVQGMTSQRMGLLLQNIITAVAGVVIAFVSGWKLTLVVLACVPVIAFAGKIEMDFFQGFSQKNKEAYGECGQVASEAIGGIRTVSSFTCENKVIDKFDKCLIKPIKSSVRKSNISGLSFGFSQATLFFIYTLTYWYGGKLVSDLEWKASDATLAASCSATTTPPYSGFDTEEVCIKAFNTIEGFGAMMRVFFAIIMSAMGVGNSMAFAPDMAKAKNAAVAIFDLLDRHSLIDPFNTKGETPAKLEGNIEFKNISFRYPSRPNKVIFEGFNLSVPQGKKVALVGDSGGGKSTVISLLERFYDPLEGTVTLDGVELKDLNINWLRNNLGLVGQEPFLFSGTIFDNITYGKKDATMEEVVEAAKSANAHSFIETLPDGYHTQLGDKFTQLSGGQKQRVAIARAIIRDPKILLLDEATSALDSVSEKIVQQALDNVMKGRTTIVIAHRLSTIMDSDIIAVVKGGKVIEIGNHESLLAQNGFYCQLVSRQI